VCSCSENGNVDADLSDHIVMFIHHYHLLLSYYYYCHSTSVVVVAVVVIKPLNPELNPMCCLLALLGAHHFLCVSRIRVKSLTFRRLMSYIYGAPILDVSRSHTTTQHSR